MKAYETVIGLEIHCELATKTKIFCSCPTEFGAEENENVCPVCLGLPGSLPVLNEKVVEYAVKAGLALNCEIANYSKSDRKNYFYPDLPKAYQISQFDLPLCVGGYLMIEDEQGSPKKIGITRIHIEEDAGKLIHTSSGTLLDNNRCGVPLIEIVTEPDMRSAFEAESFARQIRAIMRAIGVSDCRMQEGSIRFDVNLSVMPTGSAEFGTRTEMKNLNSFRALSRAVAYESQRQIDLLLDGGTVEQETRRWDDERSRSYTMRSKENAHDYRYFPDPDLAPIILRDEYISSLRDNLPELPAQRAERYANELGLSRYDAEQLTSEPEISDFFEAAAAIAEPKLCANFIIGDIFAYLKNNQLEMSDIPFSGSSLGELINLVQKGLISNTASKKVLTEMFIDPISPAKLVEKLGLAQVSDSGAIEEIAKKVLEANPKSIEDYHNGKTKAVGFLVGQVMKQSKGKANPQIVNEIITKLLEANK